jgi:phosphoribosyl 1,2-cyclic phosphate phosphodiesterase
VTGGGKIPLYASAATSQVLRSVFRYIFEGDYKYGGLAQVELKPVAGPFDLFGATFTPLVVKHGDVAIEAYRFGSAAYLTDFSEVPPETLAALEGLDVLFLDALRHHPHPTHSTVENSLKLVEQLRPRRASAGRGDQCSIAGECSPGPRRAEAGVRTVEQFERARS